MIQRLPKLSGFRGYQSYQDTEITKVIMVQGFLETYFFPSCVKVQSFYSCLCVYLHFPIIYLSIYLVFEPTGIELRTR